VKDVQMDVTAQVLHDWLVEQKPDDASHEASSCPYCAEKASTQEESVSADPIFTQEQHDQLLQSAVAKATTEAKAEVDADIVSLNEQLAEAKAALTDKDGEIADLKATIEQRDENDRLAALADERVEQVGEVASFTDEQIAARKEAWAKMSEEDFGAYLEDIKAAVAVKASKKEDPPPSNFDGTRETAGKNGTETSVIADFFGSGLVDAART
jgi:chromosome segregation ATPase